MPLIQKAVVFLAVAFLISGLATLAYLQSIPTIEGLSFEIKSQHNTIKSIRRLHRATFKEIRAENRFNYPVKKELYQLDKSFRREYQNYIRLMKKSRRNFSNRLPEEDKIDFLEAVADGMDEVIDRMRDIDDEMEDLA